MNKLDNYIFYTICEKSYEMFEETNFMTYRMFCYTLKEYIMLDNIGRKEYNMINEISEHLSFIYGLDYKTTMEYIGEYFLNDKCIIFEEPVRLVKDYFRNSFN